MAPGRPVVVLPGQYFNLWVPSLNPWSWFHVSSFTVTSLSVDKQHRLQFLAKRPNRSIGFTWLLTKSRRHLTFFSGPHGLSEPAPRYETVLLIASDAGMLAIKPETRRLCLAWHVSGQQMGMNLMTEMAGWINRLIYYNEEDKIHV
jgi:NAD(P)H-flavin reductase